MLAFMRWNYSGWDINRVCEGNMSWRSGINSRVFACVKGQWVQTLKSQVGSRVIFVISGDKLRLYQTFAHCGTFLEGFCR